MNIGLWEYVDFLLKKQNRILKEHIVRRAIFKLKIKAFMSLGWLYKALGENAFNVYLRMIELSKQTLNDDPFVKNGIIKDFTT